eukprot:scaffold2664_cov267-Pinguiococcus_pyrenoidosus.AAC.1
MSTPAWFSASLGRKTQESPPPTAPECLFLSDSWSVALPKLAYGLFCFYGGLLFFVFGGRYESCSILDKFPRRSR